MANDVDIKFGADISELQRGTDNAGKAVTAMTAPVREAATVFDTLKVSAQDTLGALEYEAKRTGEQLGKLLLDSNNFSTSITKLAGFVVGGGILAGLVAALMSAGTEMSDLVEQSDQLGVSLQRLQQLQFAASSVGIGSKTFNDDMGKMVGLLDEASRKENDLTKLFDENDKAWKKTNGDVISTNAALLIVADLVKNAANYSQQVKIAEWAGFSKEAVPFLRQGADQIQRMAELAPTVGAEQLKAAAEAERAWKATVALYESYWKTAIQNITAWFQEHITIQTGWENVKSIIAGINAELKATNAELATGETFIDRWNSLFSSTAKSVDTLRVSLRKMDDDLIDTLRKQETTKLIPEEEGKAENLARDRLRIADLMYQGEVQRIQAGFEQFRIGESEKTTALLAALKTREAAEVAALNEEAARDSMSAERIELKRKEIALRAANDRKKIINDEATYELQRWFSVGDQILSAWNSHLRGLLAGTETFKSAMEHTFGDLILKLIEMVEALVVKMLILYAIELATGTAIGGSSGIFGTALNSVLRFDKGAWSVGDSAPFPSYASGALSIPGTQLALLHQGEMVIPSGVAEAIRGGGGGGNTVNFQVSAIDGASVQSFFREHGSKIAAIVSDKITRNSSLRPAY